MPSDGGATFAPVTQTFGHSHVNTGWVVGGGTEERLDFWGLRTWTWKVEGLYMDLGTLGAAGIGSVFVNPNVGPVTGTGGQMTAHSQFTDSIVRGGLSYQFH